MNTRKDENTKCAICSSQLVEKKIDYFDSSNGHFLIIKDVPVQECVDNGHQFFHASVAKKIERIFRLDNEHALIPDETISVPVVGLDMAVGQ